MSVLIGSHSAYQEREQRGYRWLWNGVALRPQPQIGLHVLGASKQEPHIQPSLRFVHGIIGQNVALITPSREIFVRQEDHRRVFTPVPKSVLFAGVRPQIGVGIPIDNNTNNQVYQEYPAFHPQSVLRSGLNSLSVSISIENSISVPIVQEQPTHPTSVFLKGTQPNIGVPPSINDIIQVPVIQEQPSHPSSILQNSTIFTIPIGPAGLSSIVRQEAPRRYMAPVPAPLLISGVGPQAGVPPSINDIIQIPINQEQPFHPYSVFYKGIQGPDKISISLPKILISQEQPSHPLSQMFSGVRPFIGVPPSINDIIQIPINQEQPYHPASNLIPGVLAPPTITFNVGGRMRVTPQEQPNEPTTIMVIMQQIQSFAVNQPIVVKPQEQPSHSLPIMQAGASFVQSLAFNPIVRLLLTKQEQPFHPTSSFQKGIQGPNVGSGIGSILLGPQERPLDISPNVQMGVRASAAIPLRSSSITITQELSAPLPLPVVKSGALPTASTVPIGTILAQGQSEKPPEPNSIAVVIFTPIVATPMQPVLITQEQPINPQSRIVSGGAFNPPVVLMTMPLFTRQENPDHPKPIVIQGLPPVTQPVPAVLRSLFTKQEQPFHPPSLLVVGAAFVPTTFVTATLRYIFTKQELPDHPFSRLFPGNFPTTVPPITIGRSIRTTQEFPDHPSSRFATGVQGPNVGSPEFRSLLVKQETPWHPASALFPGTPPILTVPVPKSMIAAMLRQDYPDHPASRLFPGGPNFLAPAILGRSIIIRQELPGHPGSQLVPSIPPLAPQNIIGRSAFTKQEFPDHPLSKLFPGTPPTSVPAITVGRSIRTTQQLPDHPDSRFHPGVPPLPIVAAMQGALMVKLEIPGPQISAVLSSGQVFNLPVIAVTAIVTISSWTSKTKVDGKVTH